MTKNSSQLILPVIIIVIGIAGSVFLLNFNFKINPANNANNSANLRQLTLQISNMFCIGCASSVEGSLMGVSGIISANVSFAQGIGEIIYDPEKTSVEEILRQPIFQIYPAKVIADEPYTQKEIARKEKVSLPARLQVQLSYLAQLLQQGKQSLSLTEQKQIDNLTQTQNWPALENYLNQLIEKYQSNGR